MFIKAIVDEDFSNYKLPSMFIGTAYCNWKCCVENNLPISTCQNQPLAKETNIEVSADEIFSRYTSNPITSAIVFGGLEPFLQFGDIKNIIKHFRDNGVNDMFVIYTGYYPKEIENEIEQLKQFNNIIVKFGRFIPNQDKHYDNVLGVDLASDNQYSTQIS